MGEVVSFNELKMKKAYEEMAEVRLCSNFDNSFVGDKYVQVERVDIRKAMISGYMKMLSNYNN